MRLQDGCSVYSPCPCRRFCAPAMFCREPRLSRINPSLIHIFLSDIQRSIKFTAKVAHDGNFRMSDHVTPISRKRGWLNIHERLELGEAIKVFKNSKQAFLLKRSCVVNSKKWLINDQHATIITSTLSSEEQRLVPKLPQF